MPWQQKAYQGLDGRKRIRGTGASSRSIKGLGFHLDRERAARTTTVTARGGDLREARGTASELCKAVQNFIDLTFQNEKLKHIKLLT